MSYVVANRVFVKQQYTQEFEQRFRNRAGQINQQPGFVLMEVLKPQSEKTPYVVLTHWENEQAFQGWVGSEDFKLAHQTPMDKDAFLDGGGLEQYEVIISSTVDNKGYLLAIRHRTNQLNRNPQAKESSLTIKHKKFEAPPLCGDFIICLEELTDG